jgi:hypothetical protein
MPSKSWIRAYQDAGCSMFDFTPDERDNYPSRSDLLVGYTVIPELWQRAHAEPRQSTADLARDGESFYYVKIDGCESLADSDFIDRGGVEDVLDEVLSAAGLGCVIGAGTGIRYSYVDLAIIDAPASFALICKTLRDGRIGRNTRILAFDDDDDRRAINVSDP